MGMHAHRSHLKNALVLTSVFGASAILAAACLGRGNGDSTGPSQDQGTVPAAARQAQTPLVSTCANAVTPGVAATRVNQEVTVQGKVVDVEQPSGSSGPSILDVGAAYPAANNISIVILNANLAAFPDSPSTLYSGKDVCVVGVVETYQQRIAILVSTPADIAVTSQQ